jgi:hypothetical protein
MAVFVMLMSNSLICFSRERISVGVASIWGKSQVVKLANRNVGVRRSADQLGK